MVFLQEETVDFGMVVDLVDGDAFTEGLADGEDSLVSMLVDDSKEFFWALFLKFIELQMGGFDLQGSDGLKHRFLDGSTDAHDFASRLHLGRKSAICISELIEWEARDLGNDIVQGRLEGGDGVGDWNLVKGHADGNLGRDSSNWITRGLRR